jgi:hypothetical protein
LNQLSPKGKKLIEDTREIISTARAIVQEKNADELFQKFIWHTRAVDVDSIKHGSGELADKLPVDATKAQADGDEAVKQLRTLLTLILSNSEVRKLLSDFSVIGRDLLSKGAAEAATLIAPSPEELRNVNQSAPNDQFITEGGRVAGSNETPVLEARIPGTDKTVMQHPNEDQPVLKNADGTKRPLGDVAAQANDQYGQVKQQAAPAAVETLGRAQNEAQRQAEDIKDTDSPEEVEAKKRGMFDKMRQIRDNVRDGINDRIPQQHKDNANDTLERGKHFFTEEYFPEERRDQFIFRGKKVIIECQKHDDYQHSIRWLLNYFEEYAKHGRTTAGLGKDHAQGVSQTSDLKTSIGELRTLLERFANGTSFDTVTDAVDALIDDASRDQALKDWFITLDAYIRKV